MKLWVDEDLFPSLVDVAHRHGLDATCNRDRALLGRSDIDVRQRCIDEDGTLVTNNYGDFRRLYETSSVHPGLIALPSSRRQAQQHLLGIALEQRRGAWCPRRADQGGEAMSWQASEWAARPANARRC
jgi:predicted nuclease of predicted toxin-antitoxin system